MLLLVARCHDGSVETLADRATITRIGRGVDRTGQLAPASVEATLEALRDYVGEARRLGARAIAAVGTSALRDARNGPSFLEPAAAILGTPVEVISGDREARLTFLGATRGLDLDRTDVTVVDVGGGSTELVRGRSRQVSAAVSLDIGSVRLTERHLRHDPPLPSELQAVRETAARAFASAPVAPVPPVVGIAGTVTTLSAMLQGLDDYDPARIHGARIARGALADLVDRMARRTTAEREHMAGLDPRRADVIVAGALLVEAVMDQADAGELIVSNGGVRLGLAAEMLGV